MKRIPLLVVAASFAGLPAFADQASDAAVRRGVEFLKVQIPKMNSGEAAITALAMSKARVPVNDPGLAACIAKFGANFNGTLYTPEAKDGSEIQEAAVTIMAMRNIDPRGYKPYIIAAGDYILSKQMPNGAWDDSSRTAGDTSISQYALLGLWEGEYAGVEVPAKVWENAAKWFLAMQSSRGGWNLRRDQANLPDTVSMTAAGAGSLLLCRHQLARHRRGLESVNPLMTPMVPGAAAATEDGPKPEPSAGAINKGVRAGLQWIGENFQTSNSNIVGPSIYSCLYGIEHVIALARDGAEPASAEWYDRGRAYVLSNQKSAGAWGIVPQKEVSDTGWAVLFLAKATADTLRRDEILRLRKARDLSSLPSNPDDLDVLLGELVVKPMDGTLEGMLDALVDPDGGDSRKAIAGLATKYRAEGPKTFRPYKGRFRGLVGDRDPKLRRVAIWALGRSGDLDVAPLLIKALLDPDEDVMNEARVGLQFLSRKLDGYGPEPKSSPEERRAAALKWQQWFESVKPPDLDSPDILPANDAKPPAK